MSRNYDVAIIGGGPGGSTTAAFLRKYAPQLSVAIFEREQFPREHIGESQLPPISMILNEIGAYDKVEAAGFPIKIGATFRWGNSDKLWDFDFAPFQQYVELPRPRKYEGQTKKLAFQVERAIYDDILLKHAEEMGAEVHMPMQVRQVEIVDDEVRGLVLDDGSRVTARYYVDASGGSALLRRAAGVTIDAPTKLMNVAFWDYWENAEWAMRFGGTSTRILVMSIGSGWIWYIPLGPTRTSIGFVCPAEFYKSSKKSPKELYDWALSQEPLIADLTKSASRHDHVRSTKDWSFVTNRVTGKNWYLVGEAAGFADPILSAGLTLTHTGAKELAHTIIALEEGELDPEWLKTHYANNQTTRVRQHIRFADFWYSANGIFTDLEEYTKEIAKDAGLELTPKMAFNWLGTGGFAHDHFGQVGIGGVDLTATRQIAQLFFKEDYEWLARKYNVYRLDLDGAELTHIPEYREGKTYKTDCYTRDKKRLPMAGLFKIVADLIRQKKTANDFHIQLRQKLAPYGELAPALYSQCVQILEFMLGEGWVKMKYDAMIPRVAVYAPREGEMIHTNIEVNERLEGANT